MKHTHDTDAVVGVLIEEQRKVEECVANVKINI